MQDRKRKSSGLAGAGLGDADDVTAGESERNGLSLDGGGGEVVFLGEGTGDGIGEAEIRKGGQKLGSFIMKQPAASRQRSGLRADDLGNTRVLGASMLFG